jgi:hypothetical protein
MTTTPFGHPLAASSSPSQNLSVAIPAAGTAAHSGWLTSSALTLAALALGLALQVNFGQYHPAAMPWLAMALAACVTAAVMPNVGRVTLAGWRPDQLMLAVALGVQFALLYATAPAATLKLDTPDDIVPFQAGIALSAALAAVGVSGTRVARAAVSLLLLAHLALGVWIIRATPAPGVDVYTFQRDACDALLHGVNPYSITFADMYDGRLPVYGPGISENGRLNFGYPYLPLSLFLAIPGHLLGDFRYAQLFALTLAGALIAYARPGDRPNQNLAHPHTPGQSEAPPLIPAGRCVTAAALLLFTPRSFFIIEAGWTEPFAILMLAATVYAACRRGRRWEIACAIAFGFLLASKQYLVLALPLILLLPSVELRGRRTSMLGIALLTAAVISLPLVLWNIGDFLHSAVMLQFHQPFRSDALSFLVSLTRGGSIAAPAWIAFPVAAAAGLLALWRCPRSPAGFAAAFAMVFFAFFATNKQAFCNYYALVLGGLCCALAATPGVSAMASLPIRAPRPCRSS